MTDLVEVTRAVFQSRFPNSEILVQEDSTPDITARIRDRHTGQFVAATTVKTEPIDDFEGRLVVAANALRQRIIEGNGVAYDVEPQRPTPPNVEGAL